MKKTGMGIWPVPVFLFFMNQCLFSCYDFFDVVEFVQCFHWREMVDVNV